MKSGNHSHYCTDCRRSFVCHKVTHSVAPDETQCLDCLHAEPPTQQEIDDASCYEPDEEPA